MESPLAGAALAPVAVGVGYSRVHVGVHYPGDVVAGLAVGGAVAVATQHWWRVRPKDPARVRDASDAPALPEGEGLVVAVNPRSGPDDYDPAADIRRILPRAEVLETTPDRGVDELLGEAAASGRARALGVAGGDGSVASAAAVAIEHGLPLAVIAAGTLNHFARDVGLETPQDTADAVVSGQAVKVDVADVNGTPFLNTSSIGAYPEMVRRRDGSPAAWASGWRSPSPRPRPCGSRRPWRSGSTAGSCRSGSSSSATASTPRAACPPPGGRGWRTGCSTSSTCAPTCTSAAPARCWPRCSASASTPAATGTSPRRRCRSSRCPGLRQVAYDGEMGEKAREFAFRKRAPLTVYCCRTD